MGRHVASWRIWLVDCSIMYLVMKLCWAFQLSRSRTKIMFLSELYWTPNISANFCSILFGKKQCLSQAVYFHIPYRTKFRRTKFSADKIFRRTKFRHQVEISAVLSDEIFSSLSYFPIQFTRKICFTWDSYLYDMFKILADKIFWRTKFSADKTFPRTKFSAASQIYGSFVCRNFVL